MNTSCKLQTLDALVGRLSTERQKGKKIIQVHGVFDRLHAGVIRQLRSAKEKADVLVLSVVSDAYIHQTQAVVAFDAHLRAEVLVALEVVDFVVLTDDLSPISCARKLNPDFLIHYLTHEGISNLTVEMTTKLAKALRDIGCNLIAVDNEALKAFNPSRNHLEAFSPAQWRYLKNPENGFLLPGFALIFEKIKNLKVLIIGDTIIDEYVYCEPLGQSLKNPLIVHRYLSEERFCGGVIAVAKQIAEFCGNLSVLSIVGGSNSFAPLVRDTLGPNIESHLFHRDDAPTVVKRRFLYENVEQKEFEICYINDSPPDDAFASEIIDWLETHSHHFDLVVVSDYGHGMLTKQVATHLLKLGCPVAVNAQTNSANLGYNLITNKYRSVKLACIDEAEARLAYQDKHIDIEIVGKDLRERLAAENLVITQGRKGSVAFNRQGDVHHTPALATQVVDRVGAGDAFFAIVALCSALDVSIEMMSLCGNVMGALAVQVVGNRAPVSSNNFWRLLTSALS